MRGKKNPLANQLIEEVSVEVFTSGSSISICSYSFLGEIESTLFLCIQHF